MVEQDKCQLSAKKVIDSVTERFGSMRKKRSSELFSIFAFAVLLFTKVHLHDFSELLESKMGNGQHTLSATLKLLLVSSGLSFNSSSEAGVGE